MVNLPPEFPDSADPNEPRPATGDTSRRNRRTLDFDELVALVLALLGIGAIFWWGISRNDTFAAQALLRRQVDEAVPRLFGPTEETTPERFQPRSLEPGQRRPTVAPQDNNSQTREGGLPSLGRRSDQPRRAVSRGVAEPETTPTAPAASSAAVLPPLDISDVPESHWAYPFIVAMYEAGYLPDFASGQFEPDLALSRGDLALLIDQSFGDQPDPATAEFSDVSSADPVAPAIDQAVAKGFMSGYPEGDFRPNQLVPRYEVLVSLAAGLDLPDASNPDQTLQAFVDTEAMPEWSRNPVAAVAENALIINYPNRDQLRPTATATRAEIVAMLHQALVNQGELPPVASDYAVPAL